MKLLSVIGEPGIGKTTAITHLWMALGAVTSVPANEPVPREVRLDAGGEVVGVELGRDRPDFAGADALSFSVLPAACAWVGQTAVGLVVADGDRLAHARFYAAARAAGRRLLVVRLVAAPGIAAARRRARGGRQADSWVAGRVTRVERLAKAEGAVALDAGGPAERTGAMLAAMVAALT